MTEQTAKSTVMRAALSAGLGRGSGAITSEGGSHAFEVPDTIPPELANPTCPRCGSVRVGPESSLRLSIWAPPRWLCVDCNEAWPAQAISEIEFTAAGITLCSSSLVTGHHDDASVILARSSEGPIEPRDALTAIAWHAPEGGWSARSQAWIRRLESTAESVDSLRRVGLDDEVLVAIGYLAITSS